ncbi:hypothetical protein SDC9_177074 [bioreactor metagenome]|uniref:Uncharacterized protein n=1 Tax=bioreactor metagenome TaxID=1076179 RepID=A0A645GRY7_9ZZZZ
MEASHNFLIKQNVVHCLCDIWIYTYGKFTHIPCTFIGVKNFVKTVSIICRAIHNFSILKCKAYMFKCKRIIFTWSIVSKCSVNGILNWCCVYLSIWNIAFTCAFYGRNIFYRESKLCAHAFNMNFIGFVHEGNKIIHSHRHLAVV